jgi:outer membrane protein assembly factor BamE (lipoprotein component of BamABCDE complex)
MNLLRFLTVTIASAVLVGCGTTDPQVRAKTSQLRQGMSQGQVKRIFGEPNKVDHDDGYHHGYHPYGYYGYRGYGRGGEEIEWEYDNYDLKVTFRRGSGASWVVKEWDY